MFLLLSLIGDPSPQWWEMLSSDALCNEIDGWLIESVWQIMCLPVT
jgi:hypothetical protein